MPYRCRCRHLLQRSAKAIAGRRGSRAHLKRATVDTTGSETGSVAGFCAAVDTGSVRNERNAGTDTYTAAIVAVARDDGGDS